MTYFPQSDVIPQIYHNIGAQWCKMVMLKLFLSNSSLSEDKSLTLSFPPDTHCSDVREVIDVTASLCAGLYCCTLCVEELWPACPSILEKNTTILVESKRLVNAEWWQICSLLFKLSGLWTLTVPVSWYVAFLLTLQFPHGNKASTGII